MDVVYPVRIRGLSRVVRGIAWECLYDAVGHGIFHIECSVVVLRANSDIELWAFDSKLAGFPVWVEQCNIERIKRAFGWRNYHRFIRLDGKGVILVLVAIDRYVDIVSWRPCIQQLYERCRGHIRIDGGKKCICLSIFHNRRVHPRA